MKVWQVGDNVVLKRDTEKFKRRENLDAAEIQRVIDEEWPDNTITWDKSRRSGALCTSPDVEAWRCGSFGPNARICKRLENHVGRCSDIFLPEDRKQVTKRLNSVKKEDLDKILGQAARGIATNRYNAEKLKGILKKESR